MCGIVGFFDRRRAEEELKRIAHRGRDGQDIQDYNGFWLGHRLHSVTGRKIRQPIESRFIANCEIYNYKEIGSSVNDALAMYNLLKGSKNHKEIILNLKRLDGVYAFAIGIWGKIYAARDPVGVKPLWYSNEGLCSEKFEGAVELNPRHMLEINIKNRKLKTHRIPIPFKRTKCNLKETLIESVEKRLPDKRFGLLFSGGIDSVILARIFRILGRDPVLYFAYAQREGLKEAADLRWAEYAAKELGLRLVKTKINVKDTITKVVKAVCDTNVVKAEVGTVMYSACKKAKEEGCKVIFSGLGSDEIFGGYKRHQDSTDMNKECVNRLLNLYESDLYRDDVLSMKNGLELRLPYLDLNLINCALGITAKDKRDPPKSILRKIALELGISKKLAYRPKKSAQYGSNVNKVFSKLVRRTKKSDYLGGIERNHIIEYNHSTQQLETMPCHARSDYNPKLMALISGGKDSILAMQVMRERGYKIICIGTVVSKNPDSYMFHTPLISMVKKQAREIRIPYIEARTKGEKEKELAALKRLFLKAKKMGVEGVSSGAIYSEYQRDRIQKIADLTGLKVFSPLWHMNQLEEVKLTVKKGFKIIISKIAAYGLNEKWLGRIIDNQAIDELIVLNKKYGINIAGEGGEYETLVTYAPQFKKEIGLKYKKKMENEYTGEIVLI